MMQDGIERVSEEELEKDAQETRVQYCLLCLCISRPQKLRQQPNDGEPSRAQRMLQDSIRGFLQAMDPNKSS